MNAGLGDNGARWLAGSRQHPVFLQAFLALEAEEVCLDSYFFDSNRRRGSGDLAFAAAALDGQGRAP